MWGDDEATIAQHPAISPSGINRFDEGILGPPDSANPNHNLSVVWEGVWQVDAKTFTGVERVVAVLVSDELMEFVHEAADCRFQAPDFNLFDVHGKNLSGATPQLSFECRLKAASVRSGRDELSCDTTERR